MNRIVAGAAVLNLTPLDWEGNRRAILGAIGEAKQLGVSLLCLPELCVTGYGCEDAFLAPATPATAWEVVAEILPETGGLVVSLGVPLLLKNALFNCAALIVDGRLAGLAAKQHLAGDGLHYEPRWFKPWPVGEVEEVRLLGERVPVGDLVFEVGGIALAFEICEDAWVAGRTGGVLAGEGIDVLLNPSASHFAFGKQAIRRRFVLEGSRAFGVSYLYANLLGNEAGRTIYDGGALVASSGHMLAVGPRLGYDLHRVTAATLDVALTRMHQAQLSSRTPTLGARSRRRVKVPFDWPRTPAPADSSVAEDWDVESDPRHKEEELTRALALALFDYLRKSRSRGFVVSLSGGADSAAVSVLVATMLRLASDALGREGLADRLGHLALPSPTWDDPRLLTGALLTTAYQATANSGEVTRAAASAVANALGATHHELDVDPLLRGYESLIEAAIGRPLTWQADDVARQNIQARVRAPSVWLLANLKNALLLSTSNRSEAAVGYATMDGDTAGGLSPIAGIDKAFLRRWLRWMEEAGPRGLGPIPELAAINAQQPTAELRPVAAGQTDEGDLMPYELLDAIERAAIRDKKSPREVLARMEEHFPELGRAQLAVFVERFFRLWCRNQWKRERYAPSFHLDDENLDPKTWCRFPILSGGFERELAALRRELEGGDP